MWRISATYTLSQLLISRVFNSSVDGWREERLLDSLVGSPEGTGHCQSQVRYWKGFWLANHLHTPSRPRVISRPCSARENETSNVKTHAGNETTYFIFYCHRELPALLKLSSTDTSLVVVNTTNMIEMNSTAPNFTIHSCVLHHYTAVAGCTKVVVTWEVTKFPRQVPHAHLLTMPLHWQKLQRCYSFG